MTTAKRSLTALTVATLTTTMVYVLSSCTQSPSKVTPFGPGTLADDAMVRDIQAADLNVFFTGSTQGNFEPCGCGGVHDGGFSRRATILTEMRKVNPNAVVVDTGDMLAGLGDARAEFLAQAYATLKYDAILVGWGELRANPAELAPHAIKYKLPLLLTNVRSTEPMGWHDVITVKRGSHRIAIIGVLDTQYIKRAGRATREKLTIDDPFTCVQTVSKKLRDTGHIVILLSYLAPDNRPTMQQKLANVDLWIDNGTRRYTRQTVDAKTQKPAGADGDDEKEYLFAASTPPHFVSRYNDRKIGRVSLKIPAGRSAVTRAAFIPVAKDVRQTEKQLEIYDAYSYSARQTVIPRLIAAAAKQDTSAAFHYVPSSQCRACHPQQYDFWAKTGHAHAYDTLVKAGRDGDPNCWSCHTIGFGQPTGFISAEKTPDLKDVGCQMCHHMDLTRHPATPTPRQGVFNLTKAWHCKRCHVQHRSPAYNYNAYIKRIACPAMDRSALPATSMPAAAPIAP